jgi:hypothetical protein
MWLYRPISVFVLNFFIFYRSIFRAIIPYAPSCWFVSQHFINFDEFFLWRILYFLLSFHTFTFFRDVYIWKLSVQSSEFNWVEIKKWNTHNTNNYNKKFRERSPRVKSDCVKRKQDPKEYHRKNSQELTKCNFIDRYIDSSTPNVTGHMRVNPDSPTRR